MGRTDSEGVTVYGADSHLVEVSDITIDALPDDDDVVDDVPDDDIVVDAEGEDDGVWANHHVFVGVRVGEGVNDGVGDIEGYTNGALHRYHLPTASSAL